MKLMPSALTALKYYLQISLLTGLAYGIIVAGLTAYGWGVMTLWDRYGVVGLWMFNSILIAIVAILRAGLFIPVIPAVVYWKFYKCKKCGFISACQTSLINPSEIKCENCGER
jgi:hypothetical protein